MAGFVFYFLPVQFILFLTGTLRFRKRNQRGSRASLVFHLFVVLSVALEVIPFFVDISNAVCPGYWWLPAGSRSIGCRVLFSELVQTFWVLGIPLLVFGVGFSVSGNPGSKPR